MAGTKVSLNYGPRMLPASVLYIVRSVSGLEEWSLNTFLKRYKCFTDNLKQNKKQQQKTQKQTKTLKDFVRESLLS